MATIAEMMVAIGADISPFEREMNQMERSTQRVQRQFETMAGSLSGSFDRIGRYSSTMSQKMKDAYKQTYEKMKPFREEQMRIKEQFFDLAQSMGSFSGSTKDFMSQLEALGKKQKSVTDNMMKNNDMAKAGFIQGIATMMAKSGQAEKISANYERMANPLYNVNQASLKVVGSLERLAKSGNAATLALQMLGPNANMKELNDMVMLINQGLMRFNAVALAAAASSVLLYGALHKANMEMNPEYAAAFTTMMSKLREAVQPMVDAFAAVMIPVYQFITAIAELIIKFNEAHPTLAKFLQGIVMLVPILTLLLSPLAIGIGLIAGFKAAFASVWMVISPLITGLAAMSATVWLVAAAIVAAVAVIWLLWNNCEGFRNAVITSWNAILSATQAVWNFILNSVLIPIWTALTTYFQQVLSNLQTWWQQNGTMIMQAAQNVWSVVSTIISVALSFIISIFQFIWPIAVMIVQGTWSAIQNLVNGAINVILGIINFFAALFTGNWSALWEATKQILSGALEALWGYIQLFGIGRVLGFLGKWAGQVLAKFSGLWSSAKSLWNNALTEIWFFFASKFEAMANLVHTVSSKFVSYLDNAWQSAKNAVQSGVDGVKNAITSGLNSALDFVKGLGSSFLNAGKGLIEMMAKGITGAIGTVTSAISNVASKVRDFLPFSPAKTGPLSDLDHLDFGGPITDSINRGFPKVQGMLGAMLTLPTIEQNNSVSSDGGTAVQPTEINITLHYNGNGSEDDANQMVDMIDKALYQKTSMSNWFNGVKG